MPRKFKVVVVDDHPLVRRGVSNTLAEESDFEVVGEGSTADEALLLCQTLSPDVVLLDANMPGNGIEAARRISSAHPFMKIVMLTIREDEQTVRAALKAGAHGYLAKGVDAAEFVSSIWKVAQGARIVSPALAARLLSESAEAPNAASAQVAEQSAMLTERERQILRLLAQGRSNVEIAAELNLRENTIKHYVTPLFRKLNVRNRTEAALVGRRMLA